MHNSLKDRVLEAIDIVDVVGERVSLVKKGKDFIGLCPFHPDHKPSMAVSPAKGIFKCWSCGAGGDAIKFVQMRDRVEFREALSTLAKRAGIADRPVSEDDRRAAQQRSQLLATVAWALDWFRKNLASPAGSSALGYAARRGLTPETIERHKIGLAPNDWSQMANAAGAARISTELLLQAGLLVRSENGRIYDRFRNRLIFPILDPLGRAIAFGGRDLGDDPAKYLNSPESPLFSKSRVLFGFDLARSVIEQKHAAIVVEGYLDAVLLHQHGFQNTVATLGTALTDAHVKLLKPVADRIYLCFDGDEAGIKAADRAVETSLRTRADVRVVVLPEGSDPADCVVRGGAAAFEPCLSGALDALEFKWKHTLRRVGGAGSQGRRAAIDQFLQFVAGVSTAGGIDPLEQNLLVGRLADLLSIPRELVFDLLNDAKNIARRRKVETGAAAMPAAGNPESGDSPGMALSDADDSQSVPRGLAAAVEEILGLLLNDCKACAWVDDTLAAATKHSRTWERLYRLCVELHADAGEYSLADVLNGCDDAALCDAVDRINRKMRGVADSRESFLAAQSRLMAELDQLRMAELRQGVREPVESDGVSLDRLIELARRPREAVLSPEESWRVNLAG